MTPHPKIAYLQSAALLALLLAGLTLSAVAQSPTGAPWPGPTAAGDRDINRTELNNFDRYLDDHPEVSRELRNNPNLINNPNWLAQHPSTQEFLRNHPGVNEELRENPNYFVKREERFERNGGDVSRREAANADHYLDQHPEVARELQRDPRLIDNPNYLAKHPSLQAYLHNHPEVKEDWKQHPYAFEKRQRQYEHNEYRKPKSQFR